VFDDGFVIRRVSVPRLTTLTTPHSPPGSNGKAADDTEEPTLLSICEDAAEKIRNPDLKRPFSSLEDAVDRLLPYHVSLRIKVSCVGTFARGISKTWSPLTLVLCVSAVQLLAAEHPMATDLREAEEAGANLLLPRQDAWLAFFTSRANNLASLIQMKRKQMNASEVDLFAHSKLPALAAQACATAKAKKQHSDFVDRQKAEAQRRAAELARLEAERKARANAEAAKQAAEEDARQLQELQRQEQLKSAAVAQYQAMAAAAAAPSGPSTTAPQQPQQQQQHTDMPTAFAPQAPGPSMPASAPVPAAPAKPPEPLTEEEKKKQWEAIKASKAKQNQRKFR
jgi:Conserved region of unknown function on GLTSCR protein